MVVRTAKRKDVSRALSVVLWSWLFVEAMFLTLSVAPTAAQEELQFKIYCARCHGETGHGDGTDGQALKAHPRNFTDCAKMATISDDTMFKATKGGGAAVGLSDEMPAWGSTFSDEEVHALMKYVRQFCKK